MARTAIISDIHANHHALSAVVEDLLNEQCSGIVCLGDVVGYNAYPGECLNYIRELGCPVVKGNHDEEVVAPSAAKMNPIARQAMDWTREHLTPDQLEWLSRLQYRRFVRTDTGASYSIVHSSLDHPKAWNYILDPRDASTHFMQQTTQLCFFGHSHIPHAFVSDGRTVSEHLELPGYLFHNGYYEVPLQQNLKYAINVGSVGQPRDNDPRSCYAIYDTDQNLILFKRVEYDVEGAQRAVLAAGLPEHLAIRLKQGC